MIKTDNKNIVLKQLPCIYYLLRFYKNQKSDVQALIDFSSKVNAITLAYALKLGFRTCHTDVRAQKIYGSIFEMFRMVLASFQIDNKFEKTLFFNKTFLLAETGMKMVLEMFFLILNNANIQLSKRESFVGAFTL